MRRKLEEGQPDSFLEGQRTDGNAPDQREHVIQALTEQPSERELWDGNARWTTNAHPEREGG